jgi:hypothetical protein
MDKELNITLETMKQLEFFLKKENLHDSCLGN